MNRVWDIQKTSKDDFVGYTINWSPWGFLNPWVINRRVPSEAGIYQLWVKNVRRLDLLTTQSSFYGGLRNSLREITDELFYSAQHLRKMINNRETWFRFSVAKSRDDLYCMREWFTKVTKEMYNEADGKEILVNEEDSEHRFPKPPPSYIRDKEHVSNSGEFSPRPVSVRIR